MSDARWVFEHLYGGEVLEHEATLPDEAFRDARQPSLVAEWVLVAPTGEDADWLVAFRADVDPTPAHFEAILGAVTAYEDGGRRGWTVTEYGTFYAVAQVAMDPWLATLD